jgi:hypothetical protein
MRMRNLAGLFMSLLVSVMVGCGGGGGGAAGSGGASGPVLSGVATKGPISGGTVTVYRIISSARLQELGHGPTGADGSYNISLPAGAGTGNASVMVKISGGSYKDESTGTTKNTDDQYPLGMRAVYSNISGVVKRGETVNVTPYTEMACDYADNHGGLSPNNIASSNGKVAAAFNLPDIVKTKPLDPNSAFPASGSDDAKKYALALATLSQYQHDSSGGATLSAISLGLSTQLASGSLSAETSSQMGAASNAYAGGSHNPNPSLNTPAGNPNAPAAIHTDPSTTTSVSIGTSLPVSAHVVKADGSAVPDGTMVAFSSSFGTLSALSAPTANGMATVNLTSATVGTALITASSGTASDSVAPISFVDPNAAASMTLTAGASSGIVNGAAISISANVTRAAGGPVPDGTVVSFSVISGTGLLNGAATTTAQTAGGIASVSLTSSVAGSVGVRATAGGVIQQLSPAEPFITQPTQAIVKLSTSGTLGTGILIGAIDTTVSYQSGLGLTAAGAVSSGVYSGQVVPNTLNAGQFRIGLTTTGGIGLGEFATLTFNIAPGNFPTAAAFSIATAPTTKLFDTLVNPLSGVNVITSVTIQ